MEDRIEIPTSEPDSPAGRTPSYRLRALSIFTLAAATVVALTMVDVGVSDPVEAEGEIAPPPTVEGDRTRPSLNAFALPGTGTVTAILELDGELVAVAAGDFWGSSIWTLDDTSGTWQVVDGVAGVSIVDAVAHPDGIAAVGFGTFDRSPVLLIGPGTDLRQSTLELETGEVPYRIDVVSGSLFVSARFGDGSSGAPSTTYLIERDQRPLPVGSGGAIIEDVLSNDGEILAVGSENGRPAMWTVNVDGSLEPIAFDLGLESSRLAAAGNVGGELVGLVISGFGTPLASTSVYRLEPPYALLDQPIPGAWNRLVAGGDELLALPDEFLALPEGALTTYQTTSGVSWVAGRTRFVPPGDGDRGERTILIEDAVFLESGDLVVAGTASGQARYPVIASEGEVGAASATPSNPWSLVDELETGRRVVYVGEIQVALFEDVVTVRGGFGESWIQPVFADELSVGGVVDVVELDFGYLLSATRPYPALWFSDDGMAWQLIERDVIDVVGSGDAALAIVSRNGESRALTVERSGVSEAFDTEPPIGARSGHVPGLGYISGPLDGAVYVSDTGERWTPLELEAAADDLQLGDAAIAIRTDAGWLRYSGSGPTTPISSPDDEASILGRDAFAVDGGLAVLDGGFWVTSDFSQWTEVPFGIWDGADGPLVFLRVGPSDVVAQLGGSNEGALFLLQR